MQNKLAKQIDVDTSVGAATIKTTTTGSAVDLAGFVSAAVVIASGTITDGTHTPKLTECDTAAGSYTDVAAGDLQGSFSAIADDAVQVVGYGGSKRFLKVVITVTGSPSTGGAYTALVVKGDPKASPVS